MTGAGDKAFVADELAAKPPIAVGYAMEAINCGLEMPFAEACQATSYRLRAASYQLPTTEYT